jgi:hypothetical protein
MKVWIVSESIGTGQCPETSFPDVMTDKQYKTFKKELCMLMADAKVIESTGCGLEYIRGKINGLAVVVRAAEEDTCLAVDVDSIASQAARKLARLNKEG